MPANPAVRIGPLRECELGEADRIFRLAFGTFLGLGNPSDFAAGRSFVESRWRSKHTKVIAAREGDRLVGSNVLTRWGSFGFFGPLSVLPEYWDRGVAQRLLAATIAVFDRWQVRQSGLFTFAHSPKHVALYQKFGYWPRYLTALMARTPAAGTDKAVLLSALTRNGRDYAIRACRKLTDGICRGLDLTGEIRAVLAQRTGDVVLISTRGVLDAFAVCLHGPGSEGGEKVCYVKFGAARTGRGVAARFDRLLGACDAFASALGAPLEAGTNLAREDAYRKMIAHGFRTTALGVTMQRPHAEGFNRADAYVIDDWR